jgi:hypothetical protein
LVGIILAACETEEMAAERDAKVTAAAMELSEEGWTKLASGLYRYVDHSMEVVCYRFNASLFCLEVVNE